MASIIAGPGYVTLAWAEVPGAVGYEFEEWNWNGLATGWYGQRVSAGLANFNVNFWNIELPDCGETVLSGTSVNIAARDGLEMEWRVRPADGQTVILYSRSPHHPY